MLAVLQASRLPGGVPMNGNFAPVFLQRRPKDGRLPIAGHGLRAKVVDEEVTAHHLNPPSSVCESATASPLACSLQPELQSTAQMTAVLAC